MTDIEPLPEPVDRIERKLDALSASVDRRFDEVSEHFVAQRQYTEFAFERLRGEMLTGFNRIESRLDRFETKLDGFENKLGRFESKFDEFVKSQASLPRRPRARRVKKKR